MAGHSGSRRESEPVSGVHLLVHTHFVLSHRTQSMPLPTPCTLAAFGREAQSLASAFPFYHSGPPNDPRFPFFEAVSFLEIFCPFHSLSLAQGCADIPTGPPWHHISGSSCGFGPFASRRAGATSANPSTFSVVISFVCGEEV